MKHALICLGGDNPTQATITFSSPDAPDGSATVTVKAIVPRSDLHSLFLPSITR